MNIIICDDDINFIEFILSKIEKVNNKDMVFFKYTDAKKVMSSTIKYDIAFLDISMGEISGFDIANYIHFLNRRCVINFITGYTQYLPKGYEFNAFRFILKDTNDKIIKNYIADIFAEYYRRNMKINIYHNDKEFLLEADQIVYIEVMKHTTIIHTPDKPIECRKSLINFEIELKKHGFIRCHKSYIVNLYCIRSISGNYLELCNNEEIPLGKKFKSQVREACLFR